MSATDDTKLDPSLVAALFVDHREELERFLLGVTRDPHLVHDAVQATFAKLVEQGHHTRPETRKAWLFRVAYHEALIVRRRQATGDRVLRGLASSLTDVTRSAEDPLLRMETVQRVKEAIDQLPDKFQQIVRMRIYEDKTFATIAAELNIPLGTALGRMQNALQKLRKCLDTNREPS